MGKAIFYDLQGTLGGDAVSEIERFTPYPFSKAALSLAKQHGYRNLVITNQSRIGNGELPFSVYRQAEERLLRDFNRDGILIDAFLCCPHQSSDGCDCKKPKIGLIRLCESRYGLDLSHCYVIGDMGKNEIVMASHAGCKGVLVLTGGGRDSLGKFRHTWEGYDADLITENVLTAVEAIVKR